MTALLAFLPHSAHVTQWEVTPEEGIVRCDLTSLEWVFVFANDADLLGVVWGEYMFYVELAELDDLFGALLTDTDTAAGLDRTLAHFRGGV